MSAPSCFLFGLGLFLGTLGGVILGDFMGWKDARREHRRNALKQIHQRN